MALADGVAGALRPAQSITWTREDGTAENLTGATITGVLVPVASGASRAIAGALAVTDATNGVFSWTYAAGDVVEGTYMVQFKAAFLASPTPAKTFFAPWTVKPGQA